jgi:NAD-dependent epimerase/dehydratase family protein
VLAGPELNGQRLPSGKTSQTQPGRTQAPVGDHSMDRGREYHTFFLRSCMNRIFYLMGSYLVTGGCGFIGSHLADALIAGGHLVRILDDMSLAGSRTSPQQQTLSKAMSQIRLLSPGRCVAWTAASISQRSHR